LKAAVEILGLQEFAVFMGEIVMWLPNLIVAAAIFVVTVIVSEYLPKIIRAGAEGMKIKYSHFIEKVARWSIWVFAILAILIQLGIARAMFMTLFTGFIAFLVIAGGLAFGLGGRDVAAEILQDLKRKMKEE
jgi:small-conductance mechanosensitive channel